MTPHDPVDPTAGRAHATLRVPAEPSYLTVLRTLAAALAAQHDFTVDDIEDLRLSVDEAAAMALTEAQPGSDLTFGITLAATTLDLSLAVPTDGAPDPDYDSFGWQVLTTLATAAAIDTSPGHLAITLTFHARQASTGD